MTKPKQRQPPRVVQSVLHDTDGSLVYTSTIIRYDAIEENSPPSFAAQHEHFLLSFILLSETDRAVAVLAPMHLDTMLGTLLKLVMAPKSATELLDGDRPLSSFSSRINAAHAFHLILEAIWRDLHLVRKIRNEFAHKIDVHTFGDAQVVNFCKALEVSLHSVPEFEVRDQGSARSRFLDAVYALCGAIGESMRSHEGADRPKAGTGGNYGSAGE